MPRFLLLSTAVALFASAGAKAAPPNLVTNGSFEIVTNGLGQLDFTTTVPGWTATGPVLVTNALTANTSGTPSEYGLKIFENPDGGPVTASPDGGNFIAMPAGTEQGLLSSIFQSMSGLSNKRTYELSLYAKVVQDFGSSGGPIEDFTVTDQGYAFSQVRPDPMGQASAVYECLTGPRPSDCSRDWSLYTWIIPFPIEPNEPLGWLMTGYSFINPPLPPPPGGLGPQPDGRGVWWLFDGVKLTAVPEPSSWAMLIVGFGIVGAKLRFSRRKLATIVPA